MNNKEKTIYDILDIVVDCCCMEIDGNKTITKEDILGRARTANVVMTRCIYVTELIFMGYTTETIALVLKRSKKDIRHLLNLAHEFRKTSKSYVLAEAESTIKCKGLSPM